MKNYSPLVTIGIPTFNRQSTLVRAIESALAQDYENLEIVISDNASTDGTLDICRRYLQKDHRIRYVRQDINKGAYNNFCQVLRLAKGEFFMWLGDDDWIDRSFVSSCLAQFFVSTDYSFVSTDALFFYSDGSHCTHVRHYQLCQDQPIRRVLTHWYDGRWPFYGLARRDLLTQFDLLDTFGGDMIYIAALAFLGKIRTVEGVFVHREVRPNCSSFQTLKRAYPSWKTSFPNLAVATYALLDIVKYNPIYRKEIGLLRRIALGVLVMVCILVVSVPKIIKTMATTVLRWMLGGDRYRRIRSCIGKPVQSKAAPPS